MDFIAASCWVALVLVVWFESDAIVHYAKALGLSLQLHVTAYENDILHDQVDYLDFLRIRYGHSFLINLITCPVCFSVWLGAAITLSSDLSFFYFPVINLLGLSLFFIIKKLY